MYTAILVLLSVASFASAQCMPKYSLSVDLCRSGSVDWSGSLKTSLGAVGLKWCSLNETAGGSCSVSRQTRADFRHRGGLTENSMTRVTLLVTTQTLHEATDVLSAIKSGKHNFTSNVISTSLRRLSDNTVINVASPCVGCGPRAHATNVGQLCAAYFLESGSKWFGQYNLGLALAQAPVALGSSPARPLKDILDSIPLLAPTITPACMAAATAQICSGFFPPCVANSAGVAYPLLSCKSQCSAYTAACASDATFQGLKSQLPAAFAGVLNCENSNHTAATSLCYNGTNTKSLAWTHHANGTTYRADPVCQEYKSPCTNCGARGTRANMGTTCWTQFENHTAPQVTYSNPLGPGGALNTAIKFPVPGGLNLSLAGIIDATMGALKAVPGWNSSCGAAVSAQLCSVAYPLCDSGSAVPSCSGTCWQVHHQCSAGVIAMLRNLTAIPYLAPLLECGKLPMNGTCYNPSINWLPNHPQDNRSLVLDGTCPPFPYVAPAPGGPPVADVPVGCGKETSTPCLSIRHEANSFGICSYLANLGGLPVHPSAFDVANATVTDGGQSRKFLESLNVQAAQLQQLEGNCANALSGAICAGLFPYCNNGDTVRICHSYCLSLDPICQPDVMVVVRNNLGAVYSDRLNCDNRTHVAPPGDGYCFGGEERMPFVPETFDVSSCSADPVAPVSTGPVSNVETTIVMSFRQSVGAKPSWADSAADAPEKVAFCSAIDAALEGKLNGATGKCNPATISFTEEATTRSRRSLSQTTVYVTYQVTVTVPAGVPAPSVADASTAINTAVAANGGSFGGLSGVGTAQGSIVQDHDQDHDHDHSDALASGIIAVIVIFSLIGVVLLVVAVVLVICCCVLAPRKREEVRTDEEYDPPVVKNIEDDKLGDDEYKA